MYKSIKKTESKFKHQFFNLYSSLLDETQADYIYFFNNNNSVASIKQCYWIKIPELESNATRKSI